MAHLDKQEDRKHWSITISINNKERSVSLHVQDETVANLILDRVNRLEEAATVGFTALDVGLQEWLERIAFTNPPLYTLIQEKLNPGLEMQISPNESKSPIRQEGSRLTPEFIEQVARFVRENPKMRIKAIKKEFHLGSQSLLPGHPLREAIDRARQPKQSMIPTIGEYLPSEPKRKSSSRKGKSSICYTVMELVAMLKVSKTTVYNLIKEGAFPCRKIKGAKRVAKEDFDKWFESTKE